MAVVALLSTAGCTNATLYASSNLTGMLSDQGLFPELFGRRSRLGKNAGLIITTVLVLIVANLVDLSSIASVGSAVSLLVFLLVGLAGWQRRADTGSNPIVVAAAVTVIGVVLVFFSIDTIRNDLGSFIAIIAIAVGSFVLDALFRHPTPPAEAVG
jgi:amino acid transporter